MRCVPRISGRVVSLGNLCLATTSSVIPRALPKRRTLTSIASYPVYTRISPQTPGKSSNSVSVQLDLLRDAISRNDLRDMHNRYHAFIRQLSLGYDKNLKPTDTEPIIYDLVIALAASARSFDLELLQTIFMNMARGVLKCSHTDEFHNDIFQLLCFKLTYKGLIHWLRQLPKWTGGFKPTTEMWLMGLEKCSTNGTAAAANFQLQSMIEMGCKPTKEIIIGHLRILRKFRSTFARPIILALHETRMLYDPDIGDAIYDVFVHKDETMAIQMKERYEKDFKFVKPMTGLASENPLAARIMLEIQEMSRRRGPRAAALLCKRRMDRGFKAGTRTISLILERSRSVEELQMVEEILGIKADSLHWTMLINNSILMGGVSEAVKIYSAMLSADTRADYGAVTALIRALTTPTATTGTAEQVQEAYRIYEQFMDTHRKHPYFSRFITTGGGMFSKNTSYLPDTRLFELIMNPLGRLITYDTSGTWRRQLRKVMDDWKEFAPNWHSFGMIGAEINLAANRDEAYRLYRHYVDKLNVRLDLREYVLLLKVFAKLEPGEMNPKQYFKIAADMFAAGFPSISVYTIFMGHYLSHLKQLVKQKDKDDLAVQRIVQIIKAVQRRALTDTTVKPDERFWLVLMNAYGYIGMYKEAFTVIDSFLERGDFYAACISVAFDICGYSGNREKTFEIRRAIERMGYPMVHNNWNALIECLARLGDVKEAMEVLCEEMPSPDAKTVAMLLTFARKAGNMDEIKHRIWLKYPRLVEEALSLGWHGEKTVPWTDVGT